MVCWFNTALSEEDMPSPFPGDDQEPEVALGRLLQELYDRAGYDLRINYVVDAISSLREDAAWVDELLRTAGRR